MNKDAQQLQLQTHGLSNPVLNLLFQIIKKHLLPNQSPKLWLFGSRARGSQQKYSDIDLLFTDAKTLTEMQMSAIKDDLEESDLPYKVDLILEKDVYPPYKATIEVEKVLLKQF